MMMCCRSMPCVEKYPNLIHILLCHGNNITIPEMVMTHVIPGLWIVPFYSDSGRIVGCSMRCHFAALQRNISQQVKSKDSVMNIYFSCESTGSVCSRRQAGC